VYNKRKTFSQRRPVMTRLEEREIKRKLKNDIVEFLKIQNHYFPDLIRDIKNVMDKRKQNYVTYEIEVILYVMILKNICSIESMQGMTHAFNEDKCIKNIYKVLGLKEKDYLPHYVTINECLSKLETEELEKIRKKMIYNLIRKKSFDDGKLMGKHWLVIIDATQMFFFKERHCKHCLKRTINKGKEDEHTFYYHQVLEAKIVLGDDFIISMATEFIENTEEGASKQDCEISSFKRLSKSIKKMFPRLSICLMGDSLYACDPVFEICRENNWEFLIRYKDGRIPTIAEEYMALKEMGDNEEKVISKETAYKRKPKIKATYIMNWVNGIDYKGHEVNIMELEIDKEGDKRQEFQWITSIEIKEKQIYELAETGRKRWLIENQGFNIQKNYRYIITHANSLNYNAMKNHYLLTQLADILIQLYENGIKDVRKISRTIIGISERLLEALKKETIKQGELEPVRMQVRKYET